MQIIQQKKKIIEYTDAENNVAWKEALAGFKQIIKNNPVPLKIITHLETLRDAVLKNKLLTESQQQAIVARCNNYINGDYGKHLSTPVKNKK